MDTVYTVRLELQYEVTDLPTKDAADYAEYLLSPVLATLDTLGLTAKQVEMFDAENNDYQEICKDDIEILNDEDDEEDEEEDEDEDD